MFFRKKQRSILRQPKIYTAPRELEKKPVPKFFKVLTLLVILAIGFFYLILFSPVFKIKSIDLMGSPTDDSKTFLNQFIGKNIFRVDASDIEKQLATANPEFESVNVSLGIPSTLRVKFLERTPAIVWVSNSKNYLVDENAIAFKTVETPPAELTLVTDMKNVLVNVPSQIATSNFINFLKDAKIKITKLNLVITKFEVNETTFQVDAITDKNIKIIFDTTQSITDQIDAVEKAYTEKGAEITQYMDVRVPGKVYYQ